MGPAVPVPHGARPSRLGSTPSAIKRSLTCSAGPRGLCGDPRIFDDLKKVPQVFRNPGGSPALQNESSIRGHEPCRGLANQIFAADLESVEISQHRQADMLLIEEGL